MQLLLVEALLALASLISASPASRRYAHHVVHEKRHQLPEGWAKRDKVDGRAVLPLRIGLKQRNLGRADELLDEVSNPMSGNYAQHWSARKIADMFAPSQESIDSVNAWLAESGIDPSRIAVSASKSWITVNATVSEVESLIKTNYHVYEHTSGHLHVASDTYSLPAYLSAEHVDIVMPTLHFDVKVQPGNQDSGNELRKRPLRTRNIHPVSGVKAVGIDTGIGPQMGPQIGMSKIISALDDCDKQIIPDCLRALYHIPHGSSAQPGNSYGIAAYMSNSYHPSDLDLFFANFSKTKVGDRPILESIVGGTPLQNLTDRNLYIESSLDLEYAMALVHPQTVTLYQVGDNLGTGTFNNFLDALDGSYCDYEGGDDPATDGIFPNPDPSGYQGPADCGTSKATNVISTSYGYNEAALTPAYQQRQCYEYMKLGLQGVTVLYASGDGGVAGNRDRCLAPDGKFVNGTSGRFNPSFPATCPYVTAVGATQVLNGTNILRDLDRKVQPEVACETRILSGGGFSNPTPCPTTSRSTSRPTAPTSTTTPAARAGFPDVSANGAAYVVAVKGGFHQVYGTSASSPTFGAVITLINERRLAKGKGPVGFLNPALYAHAHVLNDVTRGNNPGCGTKGFAAAPGWDPVTGLGTPNFPKMLELFLGLP
ncbi:Pro-kumamolisin [Apiospora kogelbergensis]|uniref:Pro-kumamolisin n=1 Tax=Apiospora kogelbergensis TaxID=1337665 RepID=UPI00312DE5F9